MYDLGCLDPGTVCVIRHEALGKETRMALAEHHQEDKHEATSTVGMSILKPEYEKDQGMFEL